MPSLRMRVARLESMLRSPEDRATEIKELRATVEAMDSFIEPEPPDGDKSPRTISEVSNHHPV